jgi:hypothetical membrane protein
MTTDDPTSRRLARLAGGLGTVVALGAVGLAGLLAPTFSVTTGNLSDLGTTAAPGVAPVFNGGLLVGGLLAVPYALPLGLRRGASRRRRAVGVGFGATALSLAGIGTFPAGTAPHLPLSVAFFVLVTLTTALDGVARRDEPTGRVALALAGGHALLWTGWLRVGPPGLAIPETAGALAIGAWVLLVGPTPVVPVGPLAPDSDRS